MSMRKSLFGGIVAQVTIFAFTFAYLTPARVQAADIKVPAGTSIMVRLAQEVSPERAKPGDVVAMTVENDVTVDGRVVVRAGAPAKGEVTRAEQNGILGKPAKLSVGVSTVTAVDGKTLPVSGQKSVEGDDKTVLAIILLLICLPLLLIKGGDAKLAAGTTIQGMTVGQVDVRASLAPTETAPDTADGQLLN